MHRRLAGVPIRPAPGFLLIFGGLDLITAFTAVIACINNAGPGLGQVGPATNYQNLSDYVSLSQQPKE